MTNLPYGLMETLVASHQRELQDFASHRRLRRRQRIETTVDARVVRDISPHIADTSADKDIAAAA